MKKLYTFACRKIVSSIRLTVLFMLLLSSTSGWSQGTTLAQGDLSIIGFNSYNTGEGLSFVIWKPILSGTEIRFTDNGFNNPTLSTATNNIRWQEQVIVWTATTNMAAGTVITFANETPSAGTLAMYNSNGQAITFWSLSNGSGDQIFAYQGVNMPTTPTPPATGSNTMTFANTLLFGVGYQSGSANTTWIAAGPATTNFSCLPSDLASGNNHIYLSGATVNCGQYIGPRTGFANAADYRAAIANVNNWDKPAGTTNLVTYNTTTFELGAAPSITGHPANKTVCAGAGTTFTVTANNATAYRWELNTGSGFATITNGGIYSGATGATLTLSATTAAMNGYQYRCVATGTSSPAATSNPATLTVNALPAVNSNPANTAICVGTGASFTAALSNVTSLVWQVNTGSGFQNITNNATYSGQGTGTLTISGATTSMNNFTYRLTGTGICSPGAETSPATLTVNAAPTISSNPSNTTICAGSGTFFAVTANNASTYQWQADTGAGFNNLANNVTYSGVNNPTLNIANVTVGMNNYQYRCIASSPCNPSATSSAVTLSVLPLVTYYRDADNDGYGNPSVTQTSCAGAPSGYVANNADCNDSNAAINPMPVSFSQNPSNNTVCQNATTTFSVASNADSYQWQLNTGSGFNNIANDATYGGGTSATLTLNNVSAGMNGYSYRAVAIKSCTGNVNSGTASLTVNVAPVVTGNLSGATVCVGGNVAFAATVSNASSYVWQVDTGSGFTNVVNDAFYSGQGTTTLFVSNASVSMNNYGFRLIANGVCSPAATAGPVSLTVNAAPSITLDPVNASICEGAGTAFSVTATNATGYQWQVNNGSGFVNLTNNSTYSGVTNSVLNIAGAALASNGFLYRCVVSGNCTPVATSASASLSVMPVVTYYRDADNDGYGNPAVTQTSCTGAPSGYVSNNTDCNDSSATDNPAVIVFGLQPVSTIVCEFSNTSFQVASNALSYQWQINTGSGFVDFSDDDTYSGTNSNTLTIFFATADLTGYMYRCVASKSCTGNVISNSATLTVGSPPAIVANITATTVCVGNTASLSGSVHNASTYNWQVSTGGSYTAVPNTASYGGLGTNTLVINNAALSMNGYRYRLIAGGSCSPPAILGPVVLTVSNSSVFYRDQDGDGFGDAAVLQSSCTGTPSGYVADGTDCNDTNSSIHPGAVEIYGNGIDENCNSITDTDAVPCSAVTTWNGTAWTPFAPVAEQGAVIAETYSIASDLNVCSLEIINNANVTVNSGVDLRVNGMLKITSGHLTIENNANLLQTGNTNANIGSITVKRNATMRRLDYVYWGAPVAGQDLKLFSPQTVSPPVGASRFYTLNEATNAFSVIPEPSGIPFQLAKGYIVRAPNNFPVNGAQATFNGTFNGVPNNGDAAIAISYSGVGQGFNLLGNPYPSTISADLFLHDNPGALYFWAHANQDAATGANYASYTTFGTAAAAGGNAPDGNIATGQGFLLKTNTSGIATFKNSMRTGNNTSSFFREANTNKSRIWLNLSNDTGMQNQILVGYMNGATMDADVSIDAKQIETNINSINSLIGDESFNIQARALPFAATDEIPLSFTAIAPGNFTISVDRLDGIFAQEQDVFLKDNLLGTIHDIKALPYSFTASAGTVANRFAIVYQNTLGTATPALAPEKIIIYKENGVVKINSGNSMMAGVKVFDVAGRLLYTQTDINATTTVLQGLKASDQVILVQIISDKNEVVTKKGVY